MSTPKARKNVSLAPLPDMAAPPPGPEGDTQSANALHVQRLLNQLERFVQLASTGRQNALEVEVARLSIELARLRHSMEPILFLGDAARLLSEAKRAVAEEEQRPERERLEQKAQLLQMLAESTGVPWDKIYRPGPSDGGKASEGQYEEFECQSGDHVLGDRETVRFKWRVVTTRNGWMKLLARHCRNLYQPTARKIENLYSSQGLSSLDTAARKMRAVENERRRQAGQPQNSAPLPAPSDLAFQAARDLIECRWVSDELLGQLRAVRNQSQASDWAKRWLMESQPEVIARFDRLAQGGELGAATLLEMSSSRRYRKSPEGPLTRKTAFKAEAKRKIGNGSAIDGN